MRAKRYSTAEKAQFVEDHKGMIERAIFDGCADSKKAVTQLMRDKFNYSDKTINMDIYNQAVLAYRKKYGI